MSDHLPPEVLTDIFTKLTINEIGRCISVCKSWYSLITSPSFVSLHTKLTASSSEPNDALLLVRDFNPIDYWRTHNEHYSIHYDTENFIGRVKNLDFPFKSCWNSNFRVIGCFNGVVCLSNNVFGYTDEVVLWNPSIRKALTLPKPLVSLESHRGSFVHSIGFGFDAAKDDFKVVRVVNFINHWDDEVPPHVEVYELKVGCWRSINLRMKIPYVIDRRSPQAFINGAVHWVGCKRGDAKSKRILSFDLKKEMFRVMKVPDCLVADDQGKFRVSVMGESLSLISFKRSNSNVSCGIWVMKQYGVRGSWIKQFSVQLTEGLREVVGFRRNGEALLSERFGQGTALISYEPESRQVKYIDVFQGKQSFEVEHFVESLALLDVKGQAAKKPRSDNAVLSKGDLDVHVEKKMKIHLTGKE